MRRTILPLIFLIPAIGVAALYIAVKSRAKRGLLPKPDEQSVPTRVIRYTPPATLPDENGEGDCWTNSIAAPYRADAWRCMAGNSIHDPCFTVAKPDAVICGMNPSNGGAGFVLKLTKPLPEPPRAGKQPPAWGWLIQLADGSDCRPFTGTRPFIDENPVNYGCSPQKEGSANVLIGDLNDKAAVWTARKAVLSQSDHSLIIESSEQVPIVAIWQ